MKIKERAGMTTLTAKGKKANGKSKNSKRLGPGLRREDDKKGEDDDEQLTAKPIVPWVPGLRPG